MFKFGMRFASSVVGRQDNGHERLLVKNLKTIKRDVSNFSAWLALTVNPHQCLTHGSPGVLFAPFSFLFLFLSFFFFLLISLT